MLNLEVACNTVVKGEKMVNKESIVQALEAAINQLEGEKLRIDGQIEVLKDVVRYFENQKPKTETPVSVSSTEVLPQTSLESLGAAQHRRAVYNPRDVIADILKAEAPLDRKAIYYRMLKKGVRIRGQNPLATVSTYLSVDPRFINAGRGMWQLSQTHDEPSDDGDNNMDESDEEEEDSVPW